MLLWIIFATMAAAAAIFIILPLARARTQAVHAVQSGVEVYKDQLRALETEVANGVMDTAEAGEAKIEISRRMLSAAQVSANLKSSRSPSKLAGRAAVVLSGAMVTIALGFYLVLGSPNLVGQPISARAQSLDEAKELPALVARVEAHLLENPKDGQGWDIIAPAYLRLRKFSEAARAYEFAIKLVGPSAARYGGMAEAIVRIQNGIVSERARIAFQKAQKLDPKLIRPRYFLAIAKEQDGEWAEAAKRWQVLLDEAPKQANWRPLLISHLKKSQIQMNSGMKGPTAEDIKAAAELSDRDRLAMVNQMVARLHIRLNKNGKDLKGWLRLVRSYSVMGMRNEAKEAVEKATKIFSESPAELAQITDLAKELKVGQ